MKKFSTINDNSLVFIPAIGMFYSMVTATFSVIISKQMDKPFTLIQAKIESLFNGDCTSLIQEFNLIEFQKLNNFIVESYEYKTSLEKHIVSMATRIAHDIKSPLQIIENLIKNQNGNSNNSFQDQFLKQINKINYISKSLLTENKKIIDCNLHGIQCLYNIVTDLISDKQIEWNTENSIIDFEYLPNKIIWLSNEQSKIKNTISNLLNNAFEASSNPSSIKITIDMMDNQKINGNGIGLSTALKFMNSIGGTLIINTEINKGTIIKLEFPNLAFPEQFAPEININTKDVILVDDNPEIINFWQEHFLFNSRKHNVMYFLNFASLKYFLSTQSTIPNFTYLLDYNILGEKSTGVDITKEFMLVNTYLITNYAEDIKLQDEIRSLGLKLIPKSMLQLKNQIIRNSPLV